MAKKENQEKNEGPKKQSEGAEAMKECAVIGCSNPRLPERSLCAVHKGFNLFKEGFERESGMDEKGHFLVIREKKQEKEPRP